MAAPGAVRRQASATSFKRQASSPKPVLSAERQLAPLSKLAPPRFPRFRSAHELNPKFTRRDDRQIPDSPKLEQFLIARDEYVGSSADGASKNGNIGSVPNLNGWIFPGFDQRAFRLQQGEKLRDDSIREPELLREDALEPSQHRPASQQLVVVNDVFQKLAAEAARGDARREDVRVWKDLHETSRKTSSSVK